MFLEWIPVLSGCYRPKYYNRPKSRGTENNQVRMLEPVVIMISNQSYDEFNPGYDAGIFKISNICVCVSSDTECFFYTRISALNVK